MGVRMMINDTRIVDIQILHQHEEEQMGRRGASERAWGDDRRRGRDEDSTPPDLGSKMPNIERRGLVLTS